MELQLYKYPGIISSEKFLKDFMVKFLCGNAEIYYKYVRYLIIASVANADVVICSFKWNVIIILIN